MHIYFSGIGGTAIGPLAQIALSAGYRVSGSDKQNSNYIEYLKKFGIHDIHIGQTEAAIAEVHAAAPIDWLVYTSALTIENPNPPELKFAADNSIRVSKRDELLNQIIQDKSLKLIAIAGTHGKTTTTGMVVWLMKRLGVPVSYSVGAKISYGDMGEFDPKSEYFVYECDEFDRNFLAFAPFTAIVSGVSWDHHEQFPTRDDYKKAFRDFIAQSQHTTIWQADYDYLELNDSFSDFAVQNSNSYESNAIQLPGLTGRQDGWLAAVTVSRLTGQPIDVVIKELNGFPGISRRMEQVVPGLYSDYAHTPEKIRGGMSVALEMAEASHKKLVVVYEPLTNRRQHYMKDDYQDCFAGAAKVYWTPSYLAREDPNQPVLSPDELISHLADPSIAEAVNLDQSLKDKIQKHLDSGDMVVGMAGGGGGSLDEWLRKEFQK